VIALPRTSIGRIALAIVLSLMAHLIVLFAPLVKLPPSGIPLPLLTARLEPLPQVSVKPVLEPPPKIAARPAPARKPKPSFQPAPVVPDTVSPGENLDENSPPETPQIDPVPQSPPASEVVENIKPVHPLPKRAQLTFIAYKGTDFQVGEARHLLEIGDDKSYTLKVGMNTTGLASVFKTFELNQQSGGTLTAQGLRPNKYSEIKNTSKGKEALDAKFVWEEKSLSFSNGSHTRLPEQAQDIISFMYQLSQMPLDKGAISMYISNGKKLERYELAVGEEEMIQTGLGQMRALPLRKIYLLGEEGLEVWLGLEYRLLPVKIRQIDRTGQIAGEMVISEIRVADE
jgi:hypothetical protein